MHDNSLKKWVKFFHNQESNTIEHVSKHDSNEVAERAKNLLKTQVHPNGVRPLGDWTISTEADYESYCSHVKKAGGKVVEPEDAIETKKAKSKEIHMNPRQKTKKKVKPIIRSFDEDSGKGLE